MEGNLAYLEHPILGPLYLGTGCSVPPGKLYYSEILYLLRKQPSERFALLLHPSVRRPVRNMCQDPSYARPKEGVMWKQDC